MSKDRKTPPAVQISPIIINGSSFADVTPMIFGYGFIHVENNGRHVTVTQRGTGTINIINNGGLIKADNTGNGFMSIDNVALGPLFVTNAGNGRVTVKTTGFLPIVINHTGDDDYIYPEFKHIV